jgi:hypothetical protein
MTNAESLADKLAHDADFRKLVDSKRKANEFNIFRVVGQTRKELCHSSFLAWLLDPRGSHGQQGVILRSFLGFLKDVVGISEADVPEKKWCDAAKVQPEWSDADGRIDVLVEIPDARMAVVIEYKVDAAEGEDQLDRYDQMEVCNRVGWRVLKLFVTPAGRSAQGGSHWKSVGFERLAAWLRADMHEWHGLSLPAKTITSHFEDVLSQIASEYLHPDTACKLLNHKFGAATLNSIAESALALAKLNVIGDARAVNEVLTEIRRASGPIRLAGVQSRVRETIRDWMSDPKAMVESSPDSNALAWCRAVPSTWLEALPRVGDSTCSHPETIRRNPRAWLLIEVWENQHRQWFTALIIAKTTDAIASGRLREHLLRHYGLKTAARSEGWQKFALQQVFDAERNGEDTDACVRAIEASVRSLVAKLQRLPSELPGLLGPS